MTTCLRPYPLTPALPEGVRDKLPARGRGSRWGAIRDVNFDNRQLTTDKPICGKGYMMISKMKLLAICLMSGLAVAIAGGAWAQQTSTDIWRLAPSNSLVVAAFDGRADNPSVQAIANVMDPQTREQRAKQQAAMRKAVEDFATLFGISLDFAKDISSWEGQQWAFVLLPDGDSSAQPVLMISSKDAAAADKALTKMIAPWGRIGSVGSEPDAQYAIQSFKAKGNGIEVYASASGPLVALSTSKAALVQTLKGGGFAAGSAGEKVFKALSGSMFYVFADPAVIKRFKLMSDDIPFPVSGIGLGISAVRHRHEIPSARLPGRKRRGVPQAGAGAAGHWSSVGQSGHSVHIVGGCIAA